MLARVGLRKPLRNSDEPNGASSSNRIVKVTEYIVGQQLDDALAAGEDLEVSWPFAEGTIKDFTEAEALW